MTGLILAGVNPMTVIRYQIVVMHMVLAGRTVAGAAAASLPNAASLTVRQRLARTRRGSL